MNSKSPKRSLAEAYIEAQLAVANVTVSPETREALVLRAMDIVSIETEEEKIEATPTPATDDDCATSA